MMTVCDDLRQSVLQAAIQGKLTQQLPEDGNAEDLLQEIRAERQKLIAEKKIKKEKPQEPISESENEIPFDIPENWEWVPLGECINLISGQDLSPIQYNASGIGTVYLTGASNIEKGKVIINRWTEYPRAVAVKGDLLLTCKGTVGTTCILQEDRVHIARQIMAIRPILVCVKYMHFFIMYYVDMLKSQAKSMIPGIERASVLMAKFPLPPVTEQHRIVARVEALMAEIDELEKIEKELLALKKLFPNDMRASLLQAAMQGKLTQQLPEDGNVEDLLRAIHAEKQKLIAERKIKKEKPLEPIFENDIPFDIPDNWRWVRFGTIVEYKMGKTPPRDEPHYWGKDIPWVSIADMSDNGHVKTTKEAITTRALNERFGGNISCAGTMLMSFKLTVGRVSILDVDAVHNEAIISIFPICDTNNSMRNYLFKILPFISEFGESKNAIKGKTLNDTSIRNLLIPLPPVAEQRRIVERLDQILPLCESLGDYEIEYE